MNRHLLRMVLFILCLALPAAASAVVGFRGSTWGDLRQEVPKNGDSNLLLQGWIKQGVDWAKWGNTTLNTYATLRYRVDTEELDWNNSVGPGLGISLETYSSKGLTASCGVEYLWDRFFQTDRTDEKVVFYIGWYGWWDLKK
ncbi:MAG: hypothetical protein PHD74_03205 [Candidatus Krumholzibacteria bacterium]|nr:hypothetical protein [Candidatus Krumholzibacteria bacterium]